MNIKQLIKIHSICFKRKLQLTILIEALNIREESFKVKMLHD